MQASWTDNPARLLRYRVANLINGDSIEHDGYTITRVNGAGYTVVSPDGRLRRFGFLTGGYDRDQVAIQQAAVIAWVEADMQQAGAA